MVYSNLPHSRGSTISGQHSSKVIGRITLRHPRQSLPGCSCQTCGLPRRRRLSLMPARIQQRRRSNPTQLSYQSLARGTGSRLLSCPQGTLITGRSLRRLRQQPHKAESRQSQSMTARRRRLPAPPGSEAARLTAPREIQSASGLCRDLVGL